MTPTIVALIAVAISVVTFIWSGRREGESWRRNARLELYAEIIDSVYARLDGAYHAMASRSKLQGEEFVRHKEVEATLHALQMKLLYRLRLLGDMVTLQTAISLHRENHKVTNLVFSSDGVPTDLEIERYLEGSRLNEAAVKKFYDATRRSFGLPSLADEDEQFWRYGNPYSRPGSGDRETPPG